MPVVSHRVTPRTFNSAKRSTQRSTSALAISPSIGQPNTVDSETFTATGLWPMTCTTSRSCSKERSRVMRKFARL
ncbi:hypothetical protein D3C80_1637380 [compost metagenome]